MTSARTASLLRSALVVMDSSASKFKIVVQVYFPDIPMLFCVSVTALRPSGVDTVPRCQVPTVLLSDQSPQPTVPVLRIVPLPRTVPPPVTAHPLPLLLTQTMTVFLVTMTLSWLPTSLHMRTRLMPILDTLTLSLPTPSPFQASVSMKRLRTAMFQMLPMGPTMWNHLASLPRTDQIQLAQ